MAVSNLRRSYATLEEMNTWMEDVHDAVQDSGSIEYDTTFVLPINQEYRRKMGLYLAEELGMNYNATMYVIARTEATYFDEEDIILVWPERLDKEFNESDQGLLLHEEGHRLGRKIIQQRVQPVKNDMPEESYSKIVDYLLSENFAERTKLAVGNTLGKAFKYDQKILAGEPGLYQAKDRIGPDDLVESKRDEDIDQMVSDLDKMIDDFRTGNVSW